MQGRICNAGLSLVLVVLLGAMACSARPPRSDGAYGDVLQDSAGLDNTLAIAGGGHSEPRLLPSNDEMIPLQYQLLQQLASYNNMRNNYPLDFMRAPQDKRQIRYRQCYFNPISCFRK
ncbi:allatostatin C [Arctopsyche grandis]|uniref:allatostatin C n=1 Tax=Arctopsyche grandis TaxID=121162 RepID=UPI00406D6E59